MLINKNSLPFEDESMTEFILRPTDTTDENFKRQFYFVYRVRIDAIQPRVEARAKIQLGSDKKLTQLQDMKKGEDIFVAGTILKKMKFRQTVLTEFADEEDEELPESFEFLADNDDFLELEDDRQIVKLRGNVDASKFTTGFVLGFYGHQIADNYFEVKETILPEVVPQVEWPIVQKDSYIVFVSGLNLTIDVRRNALTIVGLNMLYRWIGGEMYFSDEEYDLVQNISRIIFAGESMTLFKSDEFSKTSELAIEAEDLAPELITDLDDIFSRYSSVVPVDLMPGKGDPTNDLWPQQPIPKAIFQKAIKNHDIFRTVTNPYKFKLANISFIGTSGIFILCLYTNIGENVTDMVSLTKDMSALDVMERSLECGLIAPTCPDSIDGFPFSYKDPFILNELPHVFFAGNQKELDYRKAKIGNDGAICLLLTIPKFSESFSVALLNLKNMQVSEYNFTPP